jgi:hypothetical protein
MMRAPRTEVTWTETVTLLPGEDCEPLVGFNITTRGPGAT